MRSMSDDESQLARAAAGGDGEAFALLYDRYEQPIYNYCLRLLGNQHDAQDATQDAFVKVMRRLPEMGDRELDFGPYLYATARNASYDMIEKRKRAEPVDEIADGSGLPLGSAGPALDEDPVRAALLAADQDSIRAANSRLPARQREVLALREIEGMSYEDIADLLEMNANSVAQLISRARIRLRKELRGEAAGAIAPSSADCDRALPLLTMRQDGKLGEGGDSAWLDEHMEVCPTCPLAAEAMAEAGISYRAWAPVVPAAWLFRDTLAKAAEAVGADWSHVERPHSTNNQAGGQTGTEGDGDGKGDRTGDDGGAGFIPGAAAAESEGRRRKRGLLVGSLVAALLFGLFVATVVGGEREEPKQPSTPATFAGSTETDDSTTAKKGNTAKKAKPKKSKKKGSKSTPQPAATTTPPTQATTLPNPVAATTDEREKRPRPQRDTAGSGTWGDRDRPNPTTTPTDPPTTTQDEPPPPTTADPPPDTTSDPRDPPTSPNDPPTRPCSSRVC